MIERKNSWVQVLWHEIETLQVSCGGVEVQDTAYGRDGATTCFLVLGHRNRSVRVAHKVGYDRIERIGH
jgi:hypothetical protein